jgi:aspartate/glutamate racemase
MDGRTVTNRPNRAIAGVQVGVLTLDTRHVLVPGNVQHARSFKFPVRYEVVMGVSGAALMGGDPSALRAIVAAARALESAGVDVIVGACGSFANYQSEVAAAVDIPVFTSILLEVPLILRGLPPSRKLGLIFASTSTLTPQVLSECKIHDLDRLVVVGAESIDAFKDILEQSATLDNRALEAGLVELCIATLHREPLIGAWLIQCSDLPPYACAIQKATRLPVFDMVTFVDHVYAACRRQPYA